MVVLGQRPPLIRRQADIEIVGVVTGGRDEREHVARGDIQKRAGRTLVFHQLVGKTLQLAVDGEVDFLAGLARLARELADDAAIGIDLDAR